MLDKIDLLRANERNLDEDTHREVERKKVEYHKRLIRVLVFSPFSHQMSLLALGGLSIFHEINTRNDVPGICDRAFFYDFLFDEKGVIREEYRSLPLLSFDRKVPISDFDIVAYGMTNPGGITDFVKFMRLAGIPLKRRERENKDYPIIIGGGPAFANPVPYGSIFDYSIVGRGEGPMTDIVKQLSTLDGITQRSNNSVRKVLTGIPSLYIPGEEYTQVQRSSMELRNEEDRQSHRFSSRIIGYNTGVVVVNTGCKFECAFCQLGAEKLKNQDYSDILQTIEELFRNGIQTLIINSPTYTQFPGHKDLLDAIYNLVSIYRLTDFKLYIGSVRIDEITPEYLEKLSKFESFNHTYLKYTNDQNSSFVAVAPDFGNDRLMKLMRKGLKKEDVLSGVKTCVSKGIQNFHLYFLVGIESETVEDRRDIARLTKEILTLTGGTGELYLKVNLYIPSAQTIGQRMQMYSISDYRRFIEDINEELGRLFTAEERKKIHIITLDERRLIFESILMRGGEDSQKILEAIIDYEERIGNIDEVVIQELCQQNGIKYSDFLGAISEDSELPWEGLSDEKLLKREKYFTLQIRKN